MISKIKDATAGEIYNFVMELQTLNTKELSRLKKDLEEMNSVLSKSGVRLTFAGTENEPRCVISYTDNIAKRNAGRKRDKGYAKTVSEIFNYRKTHTSEESAVFAGVGLRTYQRRVRKYKTLNRWHEDNHLYF